MKGVKAKWTQISTLSVNAHKSTRKREEYSSAKVSREKGFWVRLADKGWCIIKLVKKHNLVGTQKIARKWRLDVSFFFPFVSLLKQPSSGFQGITDFVSNCQRWYSLQLIMGIRNYGVVVLVVPAFICLFILRFYHFLTSLRVWNKIWLPILISFLSAY